MNMKLKKLFKTGYLRSGRKSGQKGQALAIVLTLLLLVSLVVASALTFVGTSLKTNKTYANNTNQLYAAEAGIQDGIWQMLNLTTDDINDIAGFTPTSPAFNPFDYSNNGNNGWPYPLVNSLTTPATTMFNGYPVTINLKNTWVPLVDYNNPSPSYSPPGGVYTPPTLAQVNTIFAGNVIISGSVTTIPVYKAIITNTGASSLPVLSIGCWLPRGLLILMPAVIFISMVSRIIQPPNYLPASKPLRPVPVTRPLSGRFLPVRPLPVYRPPWARLRVRS